MRAIAGSGSKNRPLGMVHFDAHSDTWDTYFGGYKYTHGTPFRRAVEEGLLDPKRVVQIGIRGSLYKRDDNQWALDQGMRVITIEEYFDLGVEKVIAEARRVIGSGPAYVSFDVDGLDPAFAPGTGTPEIGGYAAFGTTSTSTGSVAPRIRTVREPTLSVSVYSAQPGRRQPPPRSATQSPTMARRATRPIRSR